jgi:hypothetical protein
MPVLPWQLRRGAVVRVSVENQPGTTLKVRLVRHGPSMIRDFGDMPNNPGMPNPRDFWDVADPRIRQLGSCIGEDVWEGVVVHDEPGWPEEMVRFAAASVEEIVE